MIQMKSTEVNIGSLTLKSPVMPASGAFGSEMEQVIDFNQLGAIVPKSITKNPQPGNAKPRVCETEAGMINSIGIQSKGLDYYLKHTIPSFEKYDSPVIASISAESIEEFAEMASILGNHPSVAALELNISCPNLKGNGTAFGMDAAVTRSLTADVRKVTSKPLIAKLTPNVTNIQDIALAAEAGGVDGLNVANTLLAMSIDVETRKPRIGNVMGGLSGPAVKPMIVRMIYQVAQVTSLPIIGCGGIMTGEDAIEMMIAGATAVQVGTASFIQPTALTDIQREIDDYMDKHNVDDIKELIGSIQI
ncbi:dihydroorotate dehydrogenase [Halobacillus litoralis]|uniref:Dihydroorotate dehydrogenase n=1 Tax=Halobacillus litoralis TaxID=45668 RepID=A0A845DVU1_9BACI|nr:dihydroorotate dehydrogenase [Halobacillus litoralis]MYL20615.1 dihydroorotate dehydrogenase [Halobacillus litoralis]